MNNLLQLSFVKAGYPATSASPGGNALSEASLRLRRASRAMATGADASGSRTTLLNERGAVMFVGIFMACMLVGMLWSIMGIGDALITRQAVQESVDSAAFSSATIHAKGMNLIAAVNLIMMAIVFFYLILCLVVDVLLFAAGILILTIAGIPAALTCIRVAKQVDNIANYYKKGMKVILTGLGVVQYASAYLSPWVGSAAGMNVSSKYGFMSVNLSASMVPGFISNFLPASVRPPVKGKDGTETPDPTPTLSGEVKAAAGDRLGLPVVAEKVNYLCQVVVSKIVGFFLGLLSKVGVPEEVLSPVISFIQGGLGEVVTKMHCRETGGSGSDDGAPPVGGGRPGEPGFNKKTPGQTRSDFGEVADALGGAAGSLFTVYAADDLWKSKLAGPKSMYGVAVNGSEWNQIYSFSFQSYKDQQSKYVHIGTQAQAMGLPANPPPHIYTAQSEFYFDCEQKWDHTDCNGDGKDKYDHAIFAMRWRTRLVRYKSPLSAVGSLIKDAVGAALGSGVTSYFRGLIKNSEIYKELLDSAQNSFLGKLILKQIAGGGTDNKTDRWDWVKKQISPSGGDRGPDSDSFH